MKKSAIIRIVVWTLIGIFLTVFLILGITGNGIFNFPGIDFIGFATGARYEESDSYSIGSGEVDSQGITEIEINWTAGDVDIEVYDGDTIVFSENDNLEEKYRLRYRVKQNRFTIQFYESGLNNLFSSGGLTKKLTVKVPHSIADSLNKFYLTTVSASSHTSGFNTRYLEIDTVSGEVFLSDMTADKCHIDSVSGKISGKRISFKNFETDTTSADVSVSGEVHEYNGDSVSGRINLELSVCPGSIETDTTSGDVAIYIPKDSSFSAEHDSVSGDFTTDFYVNKSEDIYSSGTGLNYFEFDSISGDVTIKGIQ